MRNVDGDGALVAVTRREVAGLARVVALHIFEKGRPPVTRVVAGHGPLDLGLA